MCIPDATPTFAATENPVLSFMSDLHTPTEFTELENRADLELTKPSKARFLFLLGFFGLFLFSWASCGTLYTYSYKSNADVKVPENTMYDPKYKVD